MINSDSLASQVLSIVVPAFNEEATLARVVEKLIEVPYLREILIVDDCSSDRTLAIARCAFGKLCAMVFGCSVAADQPHLLWSIPRCP